MEIKKVLIANRGEIACRIISTLKKLGKQSVAIYSDLDAASEHVRLADEALPIGGISIKDSYNNLDSVLGACKKSGADAVHPGYGFMAENAEFARELEKIGVTFIGPSPKCIELMGDKVQAKKVAKKHNINLVPGYVGEIENLEHAKKIVLAIGFPVLIKAAAGGGGKGMRIVNAIEELEEAISSAQSEALNSFKDGRIFIEKYIENPRHIEIQILADKHKNVVCLGERECSIQRRYQKVIEEAPSPFVDQTLREKMYQQSIRLAKSVDYYSAGTVEYIVDQQKNFYFMEMNTRIQVEHPVTELITGADIVAEMIKIAEGHELSFEESFKTFFGWAFEARVYAEDPANNFLPTTGFVEKCDFAKDATRIEKSIEDGIEVSMFYDPMVAKICVHDKTRELAIEKMQSVLANSAIAGLTNNLAFLESIFYDGDFGLGKIDTGFIQKKYKDGFGYKKICNKSLYKIAGVAIFNYFLKTYGPNLKEKITEDLTAQINGTEYCINATFDNKILVFSIGEEKFCLKSEQKTDQILFKGMLNQEDFTARVTRSDLTECVVEYNGIIAKCILMRSFDFKLFKSIDGAGKKDKALSSKVKASITGRLVSLYIKPGDSVKKGDPLFVIEAMKMQNTFTAERSGIVKNVLAKPDYNIAEGDLVLTFV